MSSLSAHMIREPTFEDTLLVRDTCLCLHAQRAARALARRFDVELRAVGITSGQFSLLMSLNRPDPPSLGSVATLLAMDRTTLTANLKPLERRGLVETLADSADKRIRRLRLTVPGKASLAGAFAIWRRVQTQIEAELVSPARLREELNILAS